VLRRHSLGALAGYGAAVALTCIVVRLVYTFAAVALVRWHGGGRRRGRRPSLREAAFVGWTGMRGGDSLIIALALPYAAASGRPFPARELIIFTTFAVILATLVLQGLTLVPVLRLLRLHSDAGDLAEEAHARRVVAQAGLRRLGKVAEEGADPPVVEVLRRRYHRRARHWAARDRLRHGAGDAEHRALPEGDPERSEREAGEYRRVRGAMLDAERRALVRLRDHGVIGDDVLRRVQRDLDLEEIQLDSAEEDAPESPFE
jgi:CPA1 family monovalent cation:H+ antiporter